MKKFLVMREEEPMPIDHHLTNVIQKYLINKIRVNFFLKQAKIY